MTGKIKVITDCSAGGIMFPSRPCMCVSVRPSVMFLQYLLCALTNFRQTFVDGVSSDSDQLIRFWGQKVKGQSHSMTKNAKNTIFGVCFHIMSGMHRQILSKLLSLVHLGTKMNWLGFGAIMSKVKVILWTHTSWMLCVEF